MKRLALCCLTVLLSLISCITWAYTSEECMKCHAEGSTGSTHHVSIKELQDSIHGSELTCQDCHRGVKDEEHENIKGSGVVDCGQCHEQEIRHGLDSGSDKRPRCHSCHTQHAILRGDKPASSIHPNNLKKTCRSCHPRECGPSDYMSWFPSLRLSSHKKQDFSQAYEKGNCVGCHQGAAAHGETKPIDHQNCHVCHRASSRQGKLQGYIHASAEAETQWATFTAAVIYQIVLILLVGGGILYYIRKFSGKPGDRRKIPPC